ncbi:MAG: glycosyltransferase family 4 protein [Nanoarchaeota archaeon]
MKKKVLAIASTFPRWGNDTTPRFAYDLAESLASKYDITVLAPHYKGALKKEKLGKVNVTRFAYFKPESLQKLCYGGGIIPNMKNSFLAKMQMPLLILTEFFAARSLLKKENISLIHAHWILPQGFVGVFLKKIFKVPLLVTIHGSDLFPLKNILFKKLQKLAVNNADFITVNTEATKKELLGRFPEASRKVRVVPMGINSDFFKKLKIKKPAKYSKNKLLLFVGRLSDQKGLQYLIDALPEIVKKEPAAKLLIIGEGPYKLELEKEISENKAENYVEFLGSLPASDVAKYHNYADIFILPSLANKTGTEALGLALMEAMSSGCAVIGTNVGGIPSLIKNGYNGILVPQKDSKELAGAIIAFLKNRKKAEIMGQNASNFIRRNYSWDKIGKEFIDIYKSIIK